MSLPPWTATLCAIYAATGDILQAMACVGIRPSEFHVLECVPEFADRIAAARRQAHRTAARIMLGHALESDDRHRAPELADALLSRDDFTNHEFLRLMQRAVRFIREAQA